MRLLQQVHIVYDSWPQSAMITGLEVLPWLLPTASIALTTSMPLDTLPNTTCFPESWQVSGAGGGQKTTMLSIPSSHEVTTVQRKN